MPEQAKSSGSNIVSLYKSPLALLSFLPLPGFLSILNRLLPRLTPNRIPHDPEPETMASGPVTLLRDPRKDFEQALAQIHGVIHAIHRPLPTETGDGTYIEKQVPSGLIRDFESMGLDVGKDLKTVIATLQKSISGDLWDDKKYLMEHIVQLAAQLPLQSQNGIRLSNSFISTLWSDLQHPPLSCLGEQYTYRQPDGSYNNMLYPHIGKANTPYARSVNPKMIRPAALPPPDVIFDSVLARDKYVPHPNKISSMLFYLASIIIHDLFRTDRENQTNSTTSSYLDLSPLYGSTWDDQQVMRTFVDGKIKPDCFSEKRLIGFPPGVSVLLIMLNRFHNYIATQLATINENGRFTKPKPSSKEGDSKPPLEKYSSISWENYLEEVAKPSLAKYDNDIFQTARLVTCGLYVNLILKDYVRTILNLNRTDSAWDLDPRTEMGKSLFGNAATEGVGNQISAEFNLVYRWHAAVSERDDKWTQAQYQKLFPGRDPSQICFGEFVGTLHQWESTLPTNPQDRPLEDLTRGENGSFDDADLVKILTESIEDCACEFGARRIPQILKMVEVLGIKQARAWNLASLNEFRKHFSLTPHETFEDINSDSYVADQLRRLYERPDFVEIYPGLIVEESKKRMDPGSGLCPGYTISRAVLSDAVALVRGDRFYTIDYNPKNLTSWGYSEANYDVNVDEGQVFYKLILRAFPNYFKPNSIYAHFPLVIPQENKIIHTKLKTVNNYNFEKPTFIPPLIPINSYAACKLVLDNQRDFKVTWGEAIEFLMHRGERNLGHDFMLSGDAPANEKSRQTMGKALYINNWQDEVKMFYEDITLKLLHQHSYKLAGVNQVDIVRDVGNLAQVHFASSVFSFPLKTTENPHGLFAESELYLIMALVFMTIFFDVDPAKSFPLRQAARKVTQQLGEVTMANVLAVAATKKLFGSIIESFHKKTPMTDYGIHMIDRLLKSKYTPEEIVWTHLLPTAGGMVANQAQLFAVCLDYYLSEGSKYLPDINYLAKLETPEADEKLLRYFMEATRIRSPVGLYRDVATPQVITDGNTSVMCKIGRRVFADLHAASLDPEQFPDPQEVKLDRDIDSYIQFGWGPHQCLGLSACKTAMTTMLKTVGRLDNLRRAPGEQGKVKTINVQSHDVFMTADQSSLFPFPTTMKIQWDGELPELEE
ncbi:MAG: hypothetical protein M1834_002892 [Cirrosporium novae-zelandiae]|nr:MAG: hypothetical protein M1834_002892 [Cirrosporium novae-zelandiae]